MLCRQFLSSECPNLTGRARRPDGWALPETKAAPRSLPQSMQLQCGMRGLPMFSSHSPPTKSHKAVQEKCTNVVRLECLGLTYVWGACPCLWLRLCMASASATAARSSWMTTKVSTWNTGATTRCPFVQKCPKYLTSVALRGSWLPHLAAMATVNVAATGLRRDGFHEGRACRISLRSHGFEKDFVKLCKNFDRRKY